jgi:hypothetical protein
MVRPGHIGNRSFRTHRLHFWAKRVVQRLQGSFLQVDVAQIIIHKTDQPDPFFDFLETNGLTGEYRAEIHFLAVQADASAAGDLDGRVMEGIGQFRQAAIGAQGRSINGRSLWNSPRNSSNLLCCCRQFIPAGRVVSFLSVRRMRSCRPFYCG